MLLDPEERWLVDNLGYVDQGSLWIYDVLKREVRKCRVSDARFLTLHQGEDRHFSVAHHYDDSRLDITVHSFLEPEIELAKVSLKRGAQAATGALELWSKVPAHYVSNTNGNQGDGPGYWLVSIMKDGRIGVREFDWYTDERFDKGYQGIVGVFKVPEKELLLVSVQRSSVLIIEEEKTGREVGSIDLGGFCGAPDLYFDSREKAIWASDYDSIVRLNPDTFEVMSRIRLQETDNEVSHLFIGQYLFDSIGKNCLVPRPFSADALVLDTGTLKVKARVDLGHQPLVGALLSDGGIICRNWKDGEVLEGCSSSAD